MSLNRLEAEITELENRRYQAMIDADVSVLAELLSDQLVYTHTRGNRDTKTTYLENLGNNTMKYVEIDHPIEQLIVTETSAIVVGRMSAKIIKNGQPALLNNVATSVWIKYPEGWRFSAFHATPLP